METEILNGNLVDTYTSTFFSLVVLPISVQRAAVLFLSTVVLFSCILSLFLLDFLVCLIRIVCLSIFVQALVCRVALNLVYSRHFEMSQIIKRIDQHQIHWYYVYFDVYNTDALFVQNSFMCSSFTLIVLYRVLYFDEMCFGPLCVCVCVCVCISIVQKSNWDR